MTVGTPCCEGAEPESEPARCPRSGHVGEPVAWRTVAALTSIPLPPKQNFRLCRDPDCDLVYFGDAGARIVLSALGVRPGFKRGGDLLCYCFQLCRQEVESEMATKGATSIPERIASQVKAGACACDVRNPSGKCCLKEVAAFARDALEGSWAAATD